MRKADGRNLNCLKQLIEKILFLLLLRTAFLYFYPAAEDFGIGVSRFAEKIFIRGADREQRRINSVDRCGESYVFISAEIELYAYGFAAERGDSFFN